MLPDGQLATIVIDHGSETWKVGWAGEDSPRILLPPVVGVPKNSHLMIGLSSKERYIGDEAISKRGVLRLSYPFKRGIINDWDNMEKLWHYTFYNELRVDPSEHRLLATTATSTPNTQREQTCEAFFEVFQVPGLHLAPRHATVCYSAGVGSALVAVLGDSGTCVAAVVGDRVVGGSVVVSGFGGDALTMHLRDIMSTKGYVFSTSAEMEIVKDFKRFCEVSPNYEKTMQDFKNGHGLGKTYELPSGNIIEMGDAVYGCPEAYFKPELARSSEPSLPTLIAKSLAKCDEDTRKALKGRCIVAGGSSLFMGFQARLMAEIKPLLPEKESLHMTMTPNARYDSWIGGSILASLNTFPEFVLTRQEYDEQGAIRILSKGK